MGFLRSGVGFTASAIVPATSKMEQRTLPFRATTLPAQRNVQLGLLCRCGRRPIELKGLGSCRLCYYRDYRSMRRFGGLRELVLERDQFSCRACGTPRRLVVHHRGGYNARQFLITLCIRCHVRLHHSRRLCRWVPEVLFALWRELNPSGPLQLQLPLKLRASRSKVGELQHSMRPSLKDSSSISA
jgi:hypothetical protein